jgi:hypothetical protein
VGYEKTKRVGLGLGSGGCLEVFVVQRTDDQAERL